MVRVPVLAPTAVGTKLSVIVQLLVGGSVFPQVVVLEKSPVAEMEEKLRGTSWLFVSWTDCAVLVVAIS
jgi:hypothetical protein